MGRYILACDIKKHFEHARGIVKVLNGITHQFDQQSTYSITGESGSGKSTFMHILAGLDQPNSGSIMYNNEDINQYTFQQKKLLLNRSFGLVFQLPYLINELSVIENVMLKGLIAGETKKKCI